jgi:hypothetical protein
MKRGKKKQVPISVQIETSKQSRATATVSLQATFTWDPTNERQAARTLKRFRALLKKVQSPEEQEETLDRIRMELHKEQERFQAAQAGGLQ